MLRMNFDELTAIALQFAGADEPVQGQHTIVVGELQRRAFQGIRLMRHNHLCDPLTRTVQFVQQIRLSVGSSDGARIGQRQVGVQEVVGQRGKDGRQLDELRQVIPVGDFGSGN